MACQRPTEGRVCAARIAEAGLAAEEVFGCMGGEPADRPGDGDEPAVADMVAELAEAEAEAAEADALAEAARARTGAARPRIRQTAGLALAALLAAAAVTLTVLMLGQHGKVAAQRAGDRRFVDAARDGIVALLSIEHTRARADVQRVLDLSTGQFHDDFARSADDFVKTAQDSQAVTKGSVNAAALEKVDGDQAVVLIAAVSEVSNVGGARQDPRPFRISVTVTRDGEECKMSDVEFVP